MLGARPRARRQGDAHRQSGAAGGDRGGGTPYAARTRSPGRCGCWSFGGSQGARIMADIVPLARSSSWSRQLRRRLVRRAAGARGGRRARPRHLCATRRRRRGRAVLRRSAGAHGGGHLVVSRSGASTVAELAAIGRPAILVPLPHALDQDQLANAGVLDRRGRRDPAATRTNSRPSGSPPKSPRLPPRRKSSSAMAAAAKRSPARSMPPTGSPIWCCEWRV